MTHHSQIQTPASTLTEEKLRKLFQTIHERKAKTLFSLGGAAVILPMLVEGAEAATTLNLNAIKGVASYRLLEDGSVEVSLTNGQKVVVGADNIVSTEDGKIVITDQAAQELMVTDDGAFGAVEGGAGVAAAVLGGALALAAIGGAGGSGGGGDDGDDGTAISKTVTVLDAPVKDALVFYDTDLDGLPGETEYLGLTDDNGALDVTYEPVAGARFLIIPAPVAEAAADYGWSDSFADQFADVITRDAVTDNIFNQVLQANDAGNANDQIVSPMSALVAAGVSEADVKAAFGIADDIDLDTFNFYENLSSDDPALREAAEQMSTAAVVAASVANAALAAAGADGALSAAEQQAVVANAMVAAAQVIAGLPAGTDIEDIAEAATAIAVAGALNPDLDTEAAAQTLTDGIAAGQSVDDAVADTVQSLVDDGGLTAAQAGTVEAVADAASDSAVEIEAIFENLDLEDGATPEEIEDALKADLDAAEDAANTAVADAINEELLGVNLVLDEQDALEGQVELLKGNVLENDGFSDGTGLPASTGVHSVNGAVLPENPEGSGQLASFVLSTSDWYTTTGRTVSVDTIADEIGISGFPNADYTGGSATRGSAVTTEITVEAGTVLTFDYTFASRDYIPYNDYSFLAVHATSGGTAAEAEGIVLRGESQNGTMDVHDLKGPGYYSQAGYWVEATRDGYEYTFTEAGTYNIAIGVTDVRDTIVDSKISVSDIQLVDAEGNSLPVGNFETLGNVDVEAEAVTEVAAGLITGNYGTLIIGKDGDYLYQLGGSNADPIPEGVVVTDSFEYTVRFVDDEGNETFATQSLNIKVTGVADPVDGVPTIILDVSPISAATAAAALFSGTTTNAEGGTVDLVLTDVEGNVVEVNDIAIADDGSFQVELDVTEDPNVLEDGSLTVAATVNSGGSSVTTTLAVELDTSAEEEGASANLTVGTLSGTDLPITVEGVDADANATITFSDGTNTVVQEIAENGSYTADLSELDAGSVITAEMVVVDNLGNDFTPEAVVTFQPITTVDVPDLNENSVGSAVISGESNAIGGTVLLTISDGDPATDDITANATVEADGSFSTAPLDLSSLSDGALTVTSEVTLDGQTAAGPNASANLDTDSGGIGLVILAGAAADPLNVDDPQISVEVSDLEAGSSVVVTLSDGTNTASGTTTADGKLVIDGGAFAPGAVLTSTYVVTDSAGNASDAETGPATQVPMVVNNTQNIGYQTIGEAIEAAAAGDEIELAPGQFDEEVIIDKPLSLLGFQEGVTAKFGTDELDPLTEGGSPRGEESEILGTVTVAAADVTIDGVALGNDDEPLTWDEEILTDTPGGLDNFTLQNSIIFEYKADGAPTFNANSDAKLGTYTGDTVASGWAIEGNLIGGVVDGNGGSMYLSGLADSSIDGNMFWRPGAAHLYVSSLEGTTIDDNFFYHGLHAGGADFDGHGDYFENSGYGYGYGYGGDSTEFFGRNYWVEVKGETSDLSISGNDGQFNSGGIQIYGEDAGYSFTNITISDNTFADFINADPNQVLGEGRAQSGLMGAVTVSILDGSTATNITITDNTATGAQDQILSTKDTSSLIAVQGTVAGLTVEGNALTWNAMSSTEVLDGLDALSITLPDDTGVYSALSVAGGLSGAVLIQTNTFTDNGDTAFAAPAIYILGSHDEFGEFAASVTEVNNSYDAWNNANSIDLELMALPAEFNPAGLDIETADVFYVTDEGTLLPLILGTNAAGETISGTAADELLYSGSGAMDTVDLSAGGSDTVIYNPTNSSDDISDFTFGNGAGADAITFMNISGSVLHRDGGDGTGYQEVTSGGNVSADTGLLVFTNDLDDVSATTVEAAVDSLTGLSSGDAFFVVADDGAGGDDARLYNVTIDGAGEAVIDDSKGIAFIDTNLSDISEDNFYIPEV